MYTADNATVADLVGLTFWKYIETTKDHVELVSMVLSLYAHVGTVCRKLYYILQKSVHHYAVMIAEEDGDIDLDLPR